jgi:hypothetical protein
LNAYAERFVRTIRDDCLKQMIFFGEDALRNAIREFVTHYHVEGNHQGLDNRLIVPMKPIPTNGTYESTNGLAECSTITIVRPRDFSFWTIRERKSNNSNPAVIFQAAQILTR